jgi:hypothetical protein
MMQHDVVVTGEDALTDPYNLNTVYYPPTVPRKSIYVLADAPAAPEEKVAKGWRTWTYVLGAAVVAQFFWWDTKCPQVLRGGKGYGR